MPADIPTNKLVGPRLVELRQVMGFKINQSAMTVTNHGSSALLRVVSTRRCVKRYALSGCFAEVIRVSF